MGFHSPERVCYNKTLIVILVVVSKTQLLLFGTHSCKYAV